MSKLDRHTLFIDEVETDVVFMQPNSSNALPDANLVRYSPVSRPVQISTHQDSEDNEIVRVSSGSPWKHYERKFSVILSSERHVVKCRTSSESFMIRTVDGRSAEKNVLYLRSIQHPNVERIKEMFSEDTLDASTHLHIVTECSTVSLLQVYRSPQYPTEPELGSILQQVMFYAYLRMFLMTYTDTRWP